MIISDEEDGRIWLGGMGKGCHHSLVPKAGDPLSERAGFRVLTEEDLELAQRWFAKARFLTEWVEVLRQGRILHTFDPAGRPLESCAFMETKPRLFHHVEIHKRACAQRLDHVQIVTPEVQPCLDFYGSIGFRLSEHVVDGAEDAVMVFLQRKGDPHDVVFAKGPGPCLHHVAYTVPETQNLMVAADLFVRAGFGDQVEFGPARHFSPGLARFLYLRDPDGHRVELFPSHDQTIDIEDEPMRWQAPEFQIGGWQTPPQRWSHEANAFGAR